MKLNRRTFMGSLGSLGAAGLLPFSSFAQQAAILAPVDNLLKSAPYLQSPFPDRITVRWINSLPCFSWVEFGEKPNALKWKALSTDHGLVQAYDTHNTITLQGLEPGKKYYYRVVSKVIEEFKPYKITYGDTEASEVFSFETPGKNQEEISFLVFNDIHDRPESFKHLMQFNNNEQHDFVFLNGDMFNYQTDEQQLIDHLLLPLGELFASNTPFYFSRGNHEMRGKFARHLPAYFNSREQNFYFSFQYGHMYAIVLDSGEDKEDDAPVYAGLADFDNYRLEQAAWLETEVNKPAFKKAKHKVVFSHIPLYHAGDWHGTMHCRKVWGNILNKAKIDVLISGHTHVYGIHPPEKGEHDYPIVIGGGPADGKRTLIKVKANRQSMDITMLDDAGKQVGQLGL